MTDLEAHCQAVFGLSLATLPMPAGLVRILPGTLLYGSEIAQRKPLLTQSDVDSFIERPREGYFLVGFWGHGVNSYAFYYVRDGSQSRVYFRLPFGGAHMDNEENATRIARFLPAFFEFERKQLEAGCALTAIDSMGWGDYHVTTGAGVRTTHATSLFRCKDSDPFRLLRP